MKEIVYDAEIISWVEQRLGGFFGISSRPVPIGLRRDGELVAGVVFDSWNGASVCAHLAAEPEGRWLVRDYLETVFRYPFETLRARKLIGIVDSALEARKFYEMLGFVCEATLHDATEGGDLLLYTMSRSQCKWLDRRGDGEE